MDKYLITKDNVKISISHLKNEFRRKEVIIISPGWFMTKQNDSFVKLADALTDWFDVISMDFRGHGKSKGFFTFTANELFDIQAVVNYAKRYYEKIYLLGFSLGGSTVLLHSALENDVDKVIAVSSPCDFSKIENHVWNPHAFIPTIKKMDLKCWSSIRPSLIPHEKLKPINYVDKIKVPTLFIAGENDPTVFPWHSETLYNKAICEKKYILFKNADHAEDIFIKYQDEFITACVDWINQ